MNKTAIIIGAGPAGLTAAYELVTKTNIKPIVLEKSGDIGGISKTVQYKGYRMDLGGHRFYSKNDEVMNWWKNIMPIQGKHSKDDLQLLKDDPNYDVQKKLNESGPDPEATSKVMLIRNRLSRILFLKKLFNYPISLSISTLSKLGLVKIIKITCSYLWIRLFPLKNVKSLEDFFTNRFGKELYRTFFKDYTEKVWGMSCSRIPADWGAQRVKELSMTETIKHAVKVLFHKKDKSVSQKDVITTLIGQYIYPKHGPGSLWEEVARIVQKKGGELILNADIDVVRLEKDSVKSVAYTDKEGHEKKSIKADYFISTMPVQDLCKAMGTTVPQEVRRVADGLIYRAFMTVGLLLNKVKLKNKTKIRTVNNIIPDTWMYVQEKEVKLGRIQWFNNWSPYLLADSSKMWIGLEYFCDEGDELWEMSDEDFMNFAIDEMEKIDMIDKKDVLDGTVVRVPKTYPAYFGTYNELDKIIDFTEEIENLFLIGRNGMHRYDGMEHPMLTAMAAVDNIIKGKASKRNIWEINSDQEYREVKTKTAN